jgi:hypothetical protein
MTLVFQSYRQRNTGKTLGRGRRGIVVGDEVNTQFGEKLFVLNNVETLYTS